MIKWILDPFLGNCFRINYGPDVDKNFVINKSDMAMNLEMFSGCSNPLSLLETLNVAIEIGASTAYPIVFKTTPLTQGKHTNIYLTPYNTQVLPKPYSDCVDVEKNPPKMLFIMKQIGMAYSQEFCRNVYTQFFINQEYNCSVT